MNYYSTYLPKKVIKQAYYYDSLQLSFDGFPHYNPLLYAAELEERFGIKFDSMPACSAITKYMLPRTYDIYGSSRLGTMQASSNRKDGDNLYSRKLGGKGYEITDHLGNVHAVLSDRKLWPQDTTMEGFQAEVLSRTDYWPFGMEINGRSDSSFSSYGFNGQLKINEVSGEGKHLTAPFWEYNPRVVHRWNTDPKPNSSFSPYAIMQGNPIMYSDPFGDSVKNKYQAGAKFEGLKQELKSNIKSAEKGQEKKAARQEYKANKSNFRLYDKFAEVDNIIGDFKSKNLSEFDRVNKLEFGGEEIDLIVGLKSGWAGADGQAAETKLNLLVNKATDKVVGIKNNEIHINMFKRGQNVGSLANEFGDAIFGVTRSETVYKQRNLPYFDRATTKFSFDYEGAIIKGTQVPDPNKY